MDHTFSYNATELLMQTVTPDLNVAGISDLQRTLVYLKPEVGSAREKLQSTYYDNMTKTFPNFNWGSLFKSKDAEAGSLALALPDDSKLSPVPSPENLELIVMTVLTDDPPPGGSKITELTTEDQEKAFLKDNKENDPDPEKSDVVDPPGIDNVPNTEEEGGGQS